ncbi:MAG: hypothetical protein LBE92_17110 [Chryseobacterium sp.]|jgi:hypothetical protein|uniref:hypothetical protein n=1 Tax=Chryseobacterium sp. TaxID=1871047 RepID=UPI00282258C2|nr:hypothetical protein [Chryseobacterium sp.]MDR2237845.1 hypothetical protein [Chryseobacterium sp.]
MKNTILLLILIFSSIKTLACSCNFKNIAQEYIDADFVGVVTIKKTYDNKNIQFENNIQRTYKADLVFEKIYKGKEFDALNIYGATKAEIADGEELFFGGCDLFVEKGEKFIVILNKNKNNEYWVNQCSRLIYLSPDDHFDDESEKINSYSNLFTSIEKYKDHFSELKFVNFYDKTLVLDDRTNHLKSDFTKLKIKHPSEKIGFYKVTLNDKMKISSISAIKKVGAKDQEIEKIIMKNLSLSDSQYAKNRSKELLLLLYFEDF